MTVENEKKMSDFEFSYGDGRQIFIFDNLTITFESVENPFVSGTFFSRVKLDFCDTCDDSSSPERSVDISLDPSDTMDLDLDVETSSVACTKVLSLEQRGSLVKLLQKENPRTLLAAERLVKEFTNNL